MVDLAGSPVQSLLTALAESGDPIVVTLSLPRKQQLLDWASQNEAWIIEDDYDSEFHYAGKPMACWITMKRPGSRRRPTGSRSWPTRGSASAKSARPRSRSGTAPAGLDSPKIRNLGLHRRQNRRIIKPV